MVQKAHAIRVPSFCRMENGRRQEEGPSRRRYPGFEPNHRDRYIFYTATGGYYILSIRIWLCVDIRRSSFLLSIESQIRRSA
jgi:hypothetical protein